MSDKGSYSLCDGTNGSRVDDCGVRGGLVYCRKSGGRKQKHGGVGLSAWFGLGKVEGQEPNYRRLPIHFKKCLSDCGIMAQPSNSAGT